MQTVSRVSYWLIVLCLYGEHLKWNSEAKVCTLLSTQCANCSYIQPKKCQCLNGGLCNNIDGSCRCMPNFAGKNCENRISCDFPQQTASLIYDGASFKVGDKISVKCHPNLSLVGDKIRTCFANGSWIPDAPKCKTKCPFPKLAPNIKYRTLQHTELDVIEDVTEFWCERPAILIGSHQIRCQVNGEWDGEVPTCLKPKTCKNPGTPPHAYRQTINGIDGQLDFGTSVIYGCNIGYYLNGSDQINCTVSGTWSSSTPTCIKAKCCFLESLINGKINISRIGQKLDWPHLNGNNKCLLPHTVANYYCDEQFEISGPSERTCLPSGEWSGQKLSCKAVCGVKKVITSNDGEDNNGQVWPWQVALFKSAGGHYNIIDDDIDDVSSGIYPEVLRKNFLCGGSLVSDKWIVTASHCLCQVNTNRVILKDELSVFLGKQLRDYAVKEPKAMEYPIKRLIVHPNYHPKSFDSDIGLIELYKPVVFNEVIHPVCLPKSLNNLDMINRLKHDLPDGLAGLVSGWNITSTDLRISHFKLPVVNRSYCEENYRKQENHTDTSITANMVCAGYPKGGVGTCEGHSGGPYVYAEVDPNKHFTQWFLRGVVSWGSEHCGRRAHLYSVFTNVAQFIPWINSYINSE